MTSEYDIFSSGFDLENPVNLLFMDCLDLTYNILNMTKENAYKIEFLQKLIMNTILKFSRIDRNKLLYHLSRLIYIKSNDREYKYATILRNIHDNLNLITIRKYD